MRQNMLATLTVLATTSPLFAPVALAQGNNELSLITQRRINDLAQFPNPLWFADISTWLATQKEDGTWADVNYLSGCAAQRANWPIQEHWNRLITFATAWSGKNPSVPANWTSNGQLWAAISKGIDYWFDNDYTPDDCVANGGTNGKGCPCGTPGLWNTNWYDQAILIPQLCSTTCLLVKEAELSEVQRAGCERIPLRAYVYAPGHLTSTNLGLAMQSSVNLALFTDNTTILKDAFGRSMTDMSFSDTPKVDGIHRDGSFLYHNGILYNGNYGKDMLNNFIQLEGEAIGTSYAASDSSRDAIAAQVKGSEWMIFTDSETKREYWDLNAVGRFVSFPTQDLQANSDLNFNVTKLAAATADFQGANNVNDTIRRLESNGTEKLVGNKGFWASDYMVHRRKSFVLTTKMVSTRSVGSEAINGANLYGYHMGLGTLFSYVDGSEYKDIVGAWDWNLVPGTTTLLNWPDVKTTHAGFSGKKDFVGVVSDGSVGTAVQDFIDPHDSSLSYRKAWFYLDDSVLVTTSNVQISNSVSSVADTPVITVLDNRAADGGAAYVDGKTVSISPGGSTWKGKTLFYGGNGYLSYHDDFSLTVSLGERTGNWSAISTSTAGLTTASIFLAYATIPHNSYTYAFFPATSRHRLAQEMKAPTSVPVSGDGIMGVAGAGKLSLVFWPGGETSITVDFAMIEWGHSGSITVTSEQPGAYLLSRDRGRTGNGKKLVVTMSDPTQKASSASFSLTFSGLKVKPRTADQDISVSATGDEAKFDLQLPSGGFAGSSISREVQLE